MKTSLLTVAVISGLLLATQNLLAQSTNFVLACSPAVATGPTCVAVADVNGDGKPDLICASSGALTVLTNDGTGVFSSNATLRIDGQASVVAADVNGDGKPDLISFVGNGNGSLVIFTNNGAGVFGSNATINVPLSSFFGPPPQSLAIGDVNGDGKLDLLVAPGYVYTNNGSGKFGLYATFGPTGPMLIVGDFNNDGKLDVISGGDNDTSPFEELLNNGNGVLTSNLTFWGGYESPCMVVADVNGDGRPDSIAFDNLTKTLAVFTNNGGGLFGAYSNSTPAIFTNVSWIAAADLNGDKKVDLITAHTVGYGDPVADNLFVFTNNGIGQFGLYDSVSVGRKPVFVVAVDVNGDGKPDLISVNQSDNTLTVLTNATVIPIPPLSITQVGNQSAVLWPATPWNYVVQTTTNLGSGNWTTVTDGTTNICLTVSNASPAAYYRLQPQ